MVQLRSCMGVTSISKHSSFTFGMGTSSWPGLKVALLHREATLARERHVSDDCSKLWPRNHTTLLQEPAHSGYCSVYLYIVLFVYGVGELLMFLFFTWLIFRGVSSVDVVVEPEVSHRHPVLSQGPGLIRADDWSGAWTQKWESVQLQEQWYFKNRCLEGNFFGGKWRLQRQGLWSKLYMLQKIATVLIIFSAPAIVNGNTVCLLFRGTRLMSPRPPGSSPHSFS